MGINNNHDMKTILQLLQLLTGLASLGLLVWCSIKAFRGYPSKRLSGWVLGFASAFVVLTLVVTGM